MDRGLGPVAAEGSSVGVHVIAREPLVDDPGGLVRDGHMMSSKESKFVSVSPSRESQLVSEKSLGHLHVQPLGSSEAIS